MESVVAVEIVKSIENHYAITAVLAKWFSMLLKKYVQLRTRV